MVKPGFIPTWFKHWRQCPNTNVEMLQLEVSAISSLLLPSQRTGENIECRSHLFSAAPVWEFEIPLSGKHPIQTSKARDHPEEGCSPLKHVVVGSRETPLSQVMPQAAGCLDVGLRVQEVPYTHYKEQA